MKRTNVYTVIDNDNCFLLQSDKNTYYWDCFGFNQHFDSIDLAINGMRRTGHSIKCVIK